MLYVPPWVFYVLRRENEARRQIRVKQRCRRGILLPKSPQIHLQDIWRTITTCAGTDGKHHSDLMGEDAFYSVIKHFCLSAAQLLQWWPALQRWTREKNSEDMSQEKRACRAWRNFAKAEDVKWLDGFFSFVFLNQVHSEPLYYVHTTEEPQQAHISSLTHEKGWGFVL